MIPRHRAGPELRAAYDLVDELWQVGVRAPRAVLITQCCSQRPALVEFLARTYYYLGWASSADRQALETVAVRVSRENECFY